MFLRGITLLFVEVTIVTVALRAGTKRSFAAAPSLLALRHGVRPIEIYAPKKALPNSTMHGWCANEIAEHHLSLFKFDVKSKHRGMACSKNQSSDLSLWNVPKVMERYFGLTSASAGTDKIRFDTPLHEVADCCDDVVWDCCSSCANMVTHDTVDNALDEIVRAEELVCSAEAILKFNGEWEAVVTEARRAKWSKRTASGEECKDHADCEINRLANGKKWCHVASSAKWDYCVPTVEYMCTVGGMDCKRADIPDSKCATATTLDACEDLVGCKFSAFGCLPTALTDSAQEAARAVIQAPAPPWSEYLNDTLWEKYYKAQKNNMLYQLVAQTHDVTDMIEFCSRLPYKYCDAPCTRHGFGSSWKFGQLTPFASTFGYCSLHGHYRPKGYFSGQSSTSSALLETMKIGYLEFKLKSWNWVTVWMLTSSVYGQFGPQIVPKIISDAAKSLFRVHAVVLTEFVKAAFGTIATPEQLESVEFLGVVNAPIIEEIFFRGLFGGVVRLVSDVAIRQVIRLVETLPVLRGTPLTEHEALERYAFVVTQLTTASYFGYVHVFNNHAMSSVQAVFCFWNGITAQVLHQKYGLAYTTMKHFINNFAAVYETQAFDLLFPPP